MRRGPLVLCERIGVRRRVNARSAEGRTLGGRRGRACPTRSDGLKSIERDGGKSHGCLIKEALDTYFNAWLSGARTHEFISSCDLIAPDA
jgi:hypothetical protein